MWRRIVLFPFNVEIPQADQDKTLGEKLKAEGPGILRWLVEGCLLWQQEGLEVPKSVKDATEEYRKESDPVQRFLEERCVCSEHVSVKKKDLLDAYVKWEQESGEQPAMTARRFSQSLREKGFGESKVGGKRLWKGLNIAPQR